MLIRVFTISILALVPVSAQLPAGAADKPPQDPKALELIDKADALSYSAKRAGLKDLQYVHELSHLPGLRIEVRWAAPDAQKVVVSAASGEGAPEHVRRMAEAARGPLEATGAQVLDMMLGKENRASYEGDEIVFAGPSQVRIVARSDRSKKVFQENLITFDARGLPIQMKSVTAKGAIDMSVAFEPQGELFRVKEVNSESKDGATRLSFEYQEVSGYTFVARITAKGPAMDNSQTFTGVRVDQGLKPEDLR